MTYNLDWLVSVDDHILEPLRTGDMSDIWKRLDLDRQRAVFRALIDRVTIAPSGPGQKRFDPDRINVVWKV